MEPSHSVMPPPIPSDTLEAPWAITLNDIAPANVAPQWVPGEPIPDVPSPPTMSEAADYGMICCHPY